MLFYLVVCADTDHTDGRVFSDFIGYCMALREQGVEGDFVSCFPIEEHFTWFQSSHNPSIDTIRFGETGPNGGVVNWITRVQGQAEDGDIVNIIIEARNRGRGVLYWRQ